MWTGQTLSAAGAREKVRCWTRLNLFLIVTAVPETSV